MFRVDVYIGFDVKHTRQDLNLQIVALEVRCLIHFGYGCVDVFISKSTKQRQCKKAQTTIVRTRQTTPKGQ